MYKAIVDDLVDLTKNYGSPHRVRESGIISNAPAHQRFNEFVKSLSADRRLLLADLLQSERNEAIHGVLSRIEWWASCRKVGFSFRGEPLSLNVFEGLLYDYAGRMGDWTWPDESQPRLKG